MNLSAATEDITMKNKEDLKMQLEKYDYYPNYKRWATYVIGELLGNNSNGGGYKFVIYPFGNEGKLVKGILNVYYGIEEYMIVDNASFKKYPRIKSVKTLAQEDLSDVVVLICSDREDIYEELRQSLYEVVPMDKCVDLFPKLSQLVHYRRVRGKTYHLSEQVYEVAHWQTAEFILQNMSATKIFPNRYTLIEYLLHEEVDSKLGMFMEFGVCDGISANFIAAAMPTHTIYGFDSFEGLPTDWFAHMTAGTFNRGGRLPAVRKNVELVKGWFDESLPAFLETHTGNCAFIHIDSDVYSSAKTVLSLLKDRIVKGTIIEFDEYFDYPDWQEHEYKAFQEFVEENNVKYEYLGYTEVSEAVAVRILSIM